MTKTPRDCRLLQQSALLLFYFYWRHWRFDAHKRSNWKNLLHKLQVWPSPLEPMRSANFVVFEKKYMPVSLKLHSKFCLLPKSCSIFFALNLSCPRCLDWLTGTQQLTCKKFCMYVISRISTNLAYAITVFDCRSLFPEISDWLQILQSSKMCGNCSTTFPFHTKSKTHFKQFFQTRF